MIDLTSPDSAAISDGMRGAPSVSTAALQVWVATSPQPPVLEPKALLRLLLAANGTVDDLVAALGPASTTSSIDGQSSRPSTTD